MSDDASNDATWWPTTWGRLTCGDLVRAPDGSVWALDCAITDDGVREWLITCPGRESVWTRRPGDEAVMAARPAAITAAGALEGPRLTLTHL